MMFALSRRKTVKVVTKSMSNIVSINGEQVIADSVSMA